MSIKKESGENRHFNTGAEKQHSEGKGTPVLFPGDAYIEVCKHFEAGAEHYEARNWEQGIPLSELINSMERHIADEKMGDISERHDRAIAWNAIAYLATKIRIQRGLLPKSLDDMPRYEQFEPAYVPGDTTSEIQLYQEHQARLTEPTIELVPEKGWQIRLANGNFLCAYENLACNHEIEYHEYSIPYYYEKRQQAAYHLAAYLETLK